MLLGVPSWFVGAAVGLLLVSITNAQEGPRSPSNSQPLQAPQTAYDVNDIEELFVEGERPRGEDMNILEMERVYRWKDTAARSFKTGQYEKAFPQLSVLARMGFKDAQARLSYIYLHGLGGQQKSNMEALGWLGVAATGETRPAYRNMFKQMMGEIPSEHREMVDAHVQSYRDKYGSEELGITCARSRTGHISKFVCRYTAEAQEIFIWRNLYAFFRGTEGA
ncbi:MAG: hypothetical protein OXG25_10165 [Gammaproteobacteria bacterium]|nr:hypothetical protein [Gammaproteobacteria bacterium]